MKLYYIDDDYVAYLKAFDSVVRENKSQTRPYVGVVFQVHGLNYYAPLGSPKPKHLTMNNGRDFRKIGGGVYGVINLNSMVPVPLDRVYVIDLNSIKDVKYQRLLQNQVKCIKKEWDDIVSAASALYNLCSADEVSLTPYEKTVKARCCNFILLEEKCKSFCAR